MMRSIAMTAACLGLLWATPAGAIPDGGYIGIGLGGSIASGDRGVPVTFDHGVTVGFLSGTDVHKEVIRTDFGSGLNFELRFGYLIAGVIAPEISLGGHGTFDAEDGATYPSFILRYHPVQHFIDHPDRAWDVNVYVGVGYAIGGYHPDPRIDDDGKGWEGFAIAAGAGFAYQVADSVSVGVDLRFTLPQYSSFIVNWDDDIRGTPDSTPSTLVITPAATVLFHL